MRRELTIGSTRVHDEGDCYVVAEIGHNHQGSVDKAKQLFRAAKDCGVDAVKLQKRSNRTLYTRAMYKSPYDNENSFGLTYGEHREALELGWEAYLELQRYAAEIGVAFFATVATPRSSCATPTRTAATGSRVQIWQRGQRRSAS